MIKLGLTQSSRSRTAFQLPRGPKPWETDPADKYFDL